MMVVMNNGKEFQKTWRRKYKELNIMSTHVKMNTQQKRGIFIVKKIGDFMFFSTVFVKLEKLLIYKIKLLFLIMGFLT